MACARGREFALHNIELVCGPFAEEALAKRGSRPRQRLGLQAFDWFDPPQSDMAGKCLFRLLVRKVLRCRLDRALQQRQLILGIADSHPDNARRAMVWKKADSFGVHSQ